MIKYKTKAQTLIGISSKLKKAKVCKSFIFSIDDWLKSQTNVIKNIQLSFRDTQIIVRSSAIGEDGIFTSMAGAFDSVKDISSSDTSKLILGVNTVISSYGENCNKKNEVLIQSMVKNVSISGVVFTHELNNGSPYYVINYDDISGQTDTVTSGGGEYSNRTLYVHRKAFTEVRSERFSTLLESIQEVEGVMESQFLDIEFAIDKDLQVFILQVRAITTQKNWNRSIVNNVDKALNGIETLLRNTLIPINGLYGDSTVLGQMPDWNPAEMIGRAPRALAYSLYEMLITDDSWRIARKKMGYSEPLKQPLMISLSGQPFIDTRLSFHSYLPSNLDSEICQKLVNVWLKKLKDNPQLHDKIEFDIAITTYSFDIDEKIKRLIGDRLTKKEKEKIKKSYFDLTFKLLSNDHPGSIKQASEKLNLLVEKQSFYDFKSKNLDFHQLNSIIDDCINLGTIPFSILARHGFIAKTLMLSLVSRGLLSQKECDLFFLP